MFFVATQHCLGVSPLDLRLVPSTESSEGDSSEVVGELKETVSVSPMLVFVLAVKVR